MLYLDFGAQVVAITLCLACVPKEPAPVAAVAPVAPVAPPVAAVPREPAKTSFQLPEEMGFSLTI